MQLRRDLAGCAIAILVTLLIGPAASADVRRPPMLTFKTSLGQARTGASSMCWPQEDGERLCGDSFHLLVRRYVRASPGESASLRLAAADPPDEVILQWFEPLPRDFDPNRQTRGKRIGRTRLQAAVLNHWQVPQAEGRYVLRMDAFWSATGEEPAKDASYVWGVRVRGDGLAPLPSTGVALNLWWGLLVLLATMGGLALRRPLAR